MSGEEEAGLELWEVWRALPSVLTASAHVGSAEVFEVCVLWHLLASKVDTDCDLQSCCGWREAGWLQSGRGRACSVSGVKPSLCGLTWLFSFFVLDRGLGKDTCELSQA